MHASEESEVSVARPSSVAYWHAGETPIRFESRPDVGQGDRRT
jgi:hypothetical protein